MTSHTPRRVALAIATTLALAAPLAGTMTASALEPANTVSTQAPATQQASITFTVTNNSGKSEPMHLAAVGTVGQGSVIEGYLDRSGTLHPWGQNSTPTPIDAPDATMIILKNGESTTFTMPYWFSGRVYYSFGEPMPFKYVGTVDGRTGTVQPVPWNATDPSATVDYDMAEMTYSQYGLYLNSSQVDMVAFPAVVSGTGAEGVETTGGISPGGFEKLVQSLSQIPNFATGIQRDASGEVLRVLAPAHFVNASTSHQTYLDPYINRVWNHYTTRTLTVQPDPTNNPALKFTGKVVGGKFVFTRTDDGTQTIIDKPTTSDVWGCEGALVASPDDKAAHREDRGMIARSLCADLHRGVLGTQAVSPATDPSTFYKTNSMNGGLMDHYAKEVHANMPGSKAYGFAFDDVGGYESLVHVINPTSASITIINRDSGVSTTPTNPTTPTPTNPTPTQPTPTQPTPTPGTSSASTQVTVPQGYLGYMTLNLGQGTTPSALDVLVDGKVVSKISVSGAGSVRADVPASTGAHTLTVRSTTGGTVGALSVTQIGGGTETTTQPAPSTTQVREALVNFKSSTRYGSITLGEGTRAGALSIKVNGTVVSKISVSGPGTYRADMSAPKAGTYPVQVSSTDALGTMSIAVP